MFLVNNSTWVDPTCCDPLNNILSPPILQAEDIVPIAASVTEENLNVDDIPTDNVHQHSAQENVSSVYLIYNNYFN